MLRTLMTMRTLKYEVQCRIFCRCGSILDCTRSILVDIEYDGSSVPDTRFMCCVRCWKTGSETRVQDGYQHALDRLAEMPNKDPDLLTLTITDGRTLDWDLDDEAERMGI